MAEDGSGIGKPIITFSGTMVSEGIAVWFGWDSFVLLGNWADGAVIVFISVESVSGGIDVLSIS
jgi:hypothetical protein